MTLKQLCEKLGCDYIGISYSRNPMKFYSASLHYGDQVFMNHGDSAVEAMKLAYRAAKAAGATNQPVLRVVK